jgi:RNA polymerase sigma-70 factor (ECF subfamily)
VEALRRLPRRYREVLVPHHCLDRSVEDVGAHLGIPTATVKTRLARGRAMLAGLLEAPAGQRQQGAPHARH